MNIRQTGNIYLHYYIPLVTSNLMHLLQILFALFTNKQIYNLEWHDPRYGVHLRVSVADNHYSAPFKQPHIKVLKNHKAV